jgi:hypothetical protein
LTYSRDVKILAAVPGQDDGVDRALTYSRDVKILAAVPGQDDGVDKMIPAAKRTIFTIVFCCLPIEKVRCTTPCIIWITQKLVSEFPPGVRHK